jgi:hypothetical protein
LIPTSHLHICQMMKRKSKSSNLKVLTGIRDNVVSTHSESIADGAKSCSIFTYLSSILTIF